MAARGQRHPGRAPASRTTKACPTRPGTSTRSRACSTATPTTPTTVVASSSTTGKCDGLLKAGTDDIFPIGYYEAADLDFYRQAAPYWAVCDNFHASIMGPTYPNRFYMHTAQTDRISNTSVMSDPADDLGLARGGRRVGPLLLLRRSRSSPCRASSAVASSSSVPPVPDRLRVGRPAVGELRRSEVHRRVDGHRRRRPSLRRHPRRPGLPQRDLHGGDQRARLGHARCWSSPTTSGAASSTTWRRRTGPDNDPTHAPARLPGPDLRDQPVGPRNHVAHELYDHTSILAMIEWRWGLRAAHAPRRAAARNLLETLALREPPDLAAPQ